MNILRVVSSWLARVELSLLVTALSVMIILAFLQVVLRNVFGTAFLWADPLVRHMVLWTGFVGAAMATADDRHISIDALTKFLSPRLKAIVKTVTTLFAAMVCWVLFRAAWTMMLSEQEAGGEFLLGLPSWAGLAIIPAGYLLIAIHFALLMVASGVDALRGGKEGR